MHEIQIMPNPNEGIFTVNLIHGQMNSESIAVTDITGNAVSFNTSVNSPTSVNFDLSQCNAGIYIVSIKTNNGIVAAKIQLK